MTNARGGGAIATAVMLALAAMASAQQAVREGAPALPGTGSIGGVILSGDADPKPVARATVSIAGPALRPARLVITDERGRFLFEQLPAGSFTITASKAPFIAASYGQSQPGPGAGTPIALADSQRIDNVRLTLGRATSISGRVIDEFGRPIRGAPVLVFDARRRGSAQAPADPGGRSALTDDRGVYRVTGLSPGQYLARAFPPGDYRVLLTGPFFPGGSDARQVSAEEIAWAEEQVRGGGQRGATAPSAASLNRPAPPPGRAVAYGAPYYPDAIDPATAAVISIGAGEDRAGIDFTMRLQPTARVDGQVVGGDGQPVPKSTVSIGGLTAPLPTGAFSISGLLPGTYRLTARAPGSASFAVADVVVNGVDITGMALTLEPASTISGRIQFDGSTVPPPSVDTVRVTVRAEESMAGLPPAAAVRADGSFVVSGLLPGRYRVSAAVPGAPGTPSPWRLRSATVAAQDASDVPIEIRGNEQITNALITFTDQTTEITGSLFDAAGRPAAGYQVAIFPTDEKYWVANSRRIPAPVRSATDGRFRLTGFPPGTYHLAAFVSVSAPDLADRDFLTQAVRGALTVTLAEGEKKQQDLKLGGR